MNKLFVFSLLTVVAGRASAQLNWDFSDWSPILGECKSCQRGRLVQLENDYQRYGRSSTQESSRNAKQLNTDGLTLLSADLYSLQPKKSSDDQSRVQLVYLPEGSIRSLRDARVARVEQDSSSKVLIRPVRATSFSLRRLFPRDLETSESQVSFREISPRRPTALIAEKGKEREAHEQIQLLEAALNSNSGDRTKDGELPRVFIAPTHLPPPPGYVKIPLLPSQNHVDKKKVLPQTFLTSEIQRQLPPGFVQVPLPEKVSQLSHSIPFVNPDLEPSLRKHMTAHRESLRGQSQGSRGHGQVPQEESQRGRVQNIRPGNERHQQIRPQIPNALLTNEQGVGFINQNFQNANRQNLGRANDSNRGAFAPNTAQTSRGNERGQTPQNDFSQDQLNRRPENIRLNQNNQRLAQPVEEKTVISRGQFITDQQQDLSSVTPTSHTAEVSDTTIRKQEDTETLSIPNRVQTSRGRTRQRTTPEPIIDDPIVEEGPVETPVRNVQQSSFKPDSERFFKIGSPVVKPPEFGDYSPFGGNPEFDPGFDYEQVFDLYDQDFVLPSPPKPQLITHSPDEENTDNLLEDDPFIHEEIIPETTTKSSPKLHVTDDGGIKFSPQRKDFVTTEEALKGTPPQLSPKPVTTVTPLVETSEDDSSLTTTVESLPDVSISAHSGRIRIPAGSQGVDDQSRDITTTLRPHSRRRLRPRTRIRGRTENIRTRVRGRPRHRLNVGQTQEKSTLPSIVQTDFVTNELSANTETITKSPQQDSNTFSRTRTNLANRRRRPLRTGLPGAQREASQVVQPTTEGPKEETSTLFPPFSVAKKLNDKIPEESEGKTTNARRRNPLPLLRGRFGSRLRPKAQIPSENEKEANENENLTSASDQVRTEPQQRFQQRRPRLRGRKRIPLGQRRRRVLNRVRKIGPSTPDNSFARNQIQKDDLRGSESARVSFSHPPINKIVDPISKTLELIISKNESKDTSSDKPSQQDDEPTTSVPIEQVTPLKSEGSLNIPTSQVPTADTKTTTPEPQVELQAPVASSISTTERYVSNDTINDEAHLHQISEDSSSRRAPVDNLNIEHDHSSVPSSDTEFVSPFDSLLSFVSHSSRDNSADTVLHAGSEKSKEGEGLDNSQKQHLSQESTVGNKDTININADYNYDALSPETVSSQQANDYEDYDAERANNNGSYLGSSAHVVYAVALSEPPPSENEELDNPTTVPPVDENPDDALAISRLFDNEEPATTEMFEEYSEPETTPYSVSDLPDRNISENPVQPREFSVPEKIEESSQNSIDLFHSPDTPTEFSNTIIKRENVFFEEEFTTTVSTLDTELVSKDLVNAKDINEIAEVGNPIDLHIDEAFSSSNPDIEFQEETTETPFEVEPTDELHLANESTTNNLVNEADILQPSNNNTEINLTNEETPETQQKTESFKSKDTQSFLDSFFSRQKKSKDSFDTGEDDTKKIIGTSTVTEVRSSAPVICIDGNCVIGAGIKKR